MKLSFTTLGCPGREWPEVLKLAAGFDGIELRGLGQQMDHTQNAALSPEHLDRTLAEAKAARLAFACLDTSLVFHDPEKWDVYLKEIDDNLTLARACGAPYLRVFGDRYLPGETREQAARRLGEGLAALGERARPFGVKILIETHGEFASGPKMKEIMEVAGHPNVGVLWDVHHPFKHEKEDIAYTLDAIRPWTFHVHMKDSLGPWEAMEKALPGAGNVPLAETVRRLKESGYDGFFSFEHEKRWMPYLDEPEVAFPAYLAFMRGLE